jgi:hypothetical protein
MMQAWADYVMSAVSTTRKPFSHLETFNPTHIIDLEAIILFTIETAREEANRFRKILETCDPSTTYLVPHGFPVMSCKLCSMLLSFHFLQLWPELELKGVTGVTGKNGAITHFWLEVEDYVIDITGDQYNIINARTKRKYRKKQALYACSRR